MNATNNTPAIGGVKLRNRVALAPMAGICDQTYRRLATAQGVGFVCTEMISAKGLLYHNEKTLRMLALAEDEHPVAVQLFGHVPEELAKAAQIVAQAGADIIDLNMGCPVAKVVKNGDGSALLRDVPQAAACIAAMADAVDVPVTAKIRLGWDDDSRNAVTVARALAAAGAAALTVHGRTREQGYSGHADWRAIAEVVAAVEIPVWGNGDVVDGPSAARMLAETNAAGVAIGRAAMGNPFIFHEVTTYLATGESVAPPTEAERLTMCRRHLHMLAAEKGEAVAVRQMRTHAIGYLRGLRNSAALRRELMQAETLARWDELLTKALSFVTV